MKNTGLLRRLAAMTYDALLVCALLFLATIPFIAVRGGEPVEIGDNALYRGVLVLVTAGFFVGFWTWRGRTLGMQSWGLQLETMDGGQADARHGQCAISRGAAVMAAGWARLPVAALGPGQTGLARPH